MNPAKRVCLVAPSWAAAPANVTRKAIGPAPFARALSISSRPAHQTHASKSWPSTPRLFARHHSSQPPSTTASVSAKEPERKPWRAAPHRRPDEPVYELHFTCKVCSNRSGHSISKQAYHNGTVLVKCPGCSNRHLITDHLKIFTDGGTTLEEILNEKGESLKLGGIDQNGDLEFWDKETAEKATEKP